MQQPGKMPVEAVHVIAPVAEVETVIDRILAGPERSVAIVDLSAGYVGASGCLRDRVAPAITASGKEVRWVDGGSFAPQLADRARDAQVRWLAEVASTAVSGGHSLKEVFAHRGVISGWWLTRSSKHHPTDGPYGWLFFMLHVLRAVQPMLAPCTSWHVWAEDPRTAAALAGGLGSQGVVLHAGGMGPGPGLLGRVRSLAARVLSGVTFLLRAVWASRSWEGSVDPWEGGDGIRVLIHAPQVDTWDRITAEGPHSPRAERYFSALPQHLRDRGCRVAWLPALNLNDQGRWSEILAEQAIPHAAGWMRLSVTRALGIAWTQVAWLLAYVRLFRVNRVHRSWLYEGVPMGEWLREELWELATGAALPHLVQLERQRAACEALRPEVVLQRNEFLVIGRVLGASVNGIAPVIGVQHGLMTRQVGVYQYGTGEIQEHRPDGEPADFVAHCPAPDLLAAFGEYVRDYFAAWSGFPAERVVPVGGVRHDRVLARYGGRRTAAERRQIRARLGLAGEGPLVVLCTTLPGDVEGLVSRVVAGMREAGVEGYLVVKPHPFHRSDAEVHAAARALGFTRYQIADGDVYPLIAAADVLVSVESTTLLEAYLLGTPVLTLLPESGYEVYPFRSEGIGESVRDPAAVADALRRILSDPAFPEEFRHTRERVLQRHLHNADGAACDRLWRLIVDVARPGSPGGGVTTICRGWQSGTAETGRTRSLEHVQSP